MAYIPSSGSVVAFQSDPTKLQVTASVVNFPLTQNISGSVMATQGTSPWVVAPNNSSMVTISQGSVGAVIIGGSIATATTNSSVMLLNSANVIGSVTALQGTSPWIVTGNNNSVIGVQQGSVAVAIVSGSVTVATGNSSVQLLRGTETIGSVAAYLQSAAASVITVNQGSVGAVIIGGSIATATTNSSVLLLNSTNVIGSVAVLQGTNPWANTNVGSTISYIQNSVATVIIGGSISATYTPPANQSVSGTVGASIIGAPPVTQGGTWIASVFGNVSVIGTVPVTQSTSPWIITGSVQGAFSPSGNQSVSGTVNLGVGTTTIGSVTVIQGTNPFIITGSIQGGGAGTQYLENAITPSVTGTAVMFKSNVSSSIVSVVTPSTPLPIYGSVSGTVGASIIGLAPVNVSNFPANQSVSGAVSISNLPANQSVSGTVSVSNLPANQSVSGRVETTQTGTVITSVAGILENTIQASTTGIPVFFKSNMTTSVLSVVSPATPLPVSVQGTVTTLPTGNQSVSGTVNLGIGTAQIGSVVLSGGVNAIGSVAALQGTNPWIETFSNSSIIAVPVGSVITVAQSSVAVAIVSGSVTVATGNSSVQLLTGTAYIGSVAAYLQSTEASVITVLQISSIVAIPTGSIITVWKDSSVLALQSGTVISSISGNVSVINLVTRNDTLASIAGADLTTRSQMGDAIGRTVIKPFVSEDSTIISYFGSVVSGSVTLIQASAVGKKSYITDFWAANTGSSNTLITFQDGSTSILGFTIAPAGSGSNSPGIAIPLKTNVSQDLAFKVSPSTSILYLTVKGYQAP